MAGKRMVRGGRVSPFVLDRGTLIARIRSLGPTVDTFDVEGVVDRLRSHYSEYNHKKLVPFKHCVRQTLESCNDHRKKKNKKTVDHNAAEKEEEEEEEEEEEDDDETQATTSSSRKRHRQSATSYEDKLLRTESEYLRRKRRQRETSTTSSSSLSHSSSSTSSSDSEEDMVFQANVDTEFDLMKSVLRENNGKPKPRGGDEVSNVEVENAFDSELRKTAELTDLCVIETQVAPPEGSGGTELAEGKSRDGPRFRDLGGMKRVLEELMMEVIVPLYHPQLPRLLGVRPMTGILLHGPPGCGKTKLAHAIANETGVPFYKISATEVVSGVSGASEENIRDLFKKAYRTAPSIVFIDEIDAIASKRENLQREMERRIVTQLMTCMDEPYHTCGSVDADSDSQTSENNSGYVIVIGATNRPDAIDSALRRPGRFDREIVLSVPDESARMEILSVLTQNLRLDGAFDLSTIARSTPGFVGADLSALVNQAGNLAIKRIIDRRKSEFSFGSKEVQNNEEWWRRSWEPEEMERLSITMADFKAAIKMVQPSSRREGFSSIPDVKWEDVGGLNSLRKEFDRYIVQRIKNPEYYEEFGVNLEVGFLLYGPPGCGKTLIAKAVANEAGASFIHIKGPELLNKYVGESESAVRAIFRRARTCSPCILFFDEVDALTTKRGKDGESVGERLLLQLLIELDGADQRSGVFVIGATNRLETVDPAVLRPGRFGKVMYVPLPSADERVLILKTLARSKPISADVDFDVIGRRVNCINLSGADLAAVINEAAMTALEEKQTSMTQGTPNMEPSVIKASHFEQALKKVSPSISDKQRRYYEVLSQNFRAN